jgi:uncharacterized protein (TIGR02118 family)
MDLERALLRHTRFGTSLERAMVKISVLYPHAVGAKFDFDYYVAVHMPMSLRLLGDAVRSCSVERGVEGTEVGSKPAFVALCHFVCDSRAAFEAAFLPNAAVLQGDMPEYTDIAPIIKFSEIALTR